MRYLLFLAVLFLPVASFADGGYEERNNYTYDQKVNEASNASFDKRLPPVLPGEVLNDGQHKTKVWSTAGSVSASAPPPAAAAPALPSNAQPLPGGVIVDERSRERHRGR